MPEEGESRRVVAIKEGARTNNDGRSHLVPGLRACRLAAGMSLPTERRRPGHVRPSRKSAYSINCPTYISNP